MDIRILVVNRIKELSGAKNLTVSELCTTSAIPPTTLKNILSGVSKNPGIVTIKKICDGLNISIAEFFDTNEFRKLNQEIK